MATTHSIPGLDSAPTSRGVALLGVTVGLVGALCSPPAATPFAAAPLPVVHEVAA